MNEYILNFSLLYIATAKSIFEITDHSPQRNWTYRTLSKNTYIMYSSVWALAEYARHETPHGHSNTHTVRSLKDSTSPAYLFVRSNWETSRCDAPTNAQQWPGWKTMHWLLNWTLVPRANVLMQSIHRIIHSLFIPRNSIWRQLAHVTIWLSFRRCNSSGIADAAGPSNKMSGHGWWPFPRQNVMLKAQYRERQDWIWSGSCTRPPFYDDGWGLHFLGLRNGVRQPATPAATRGIMIVTGKKYNPKYNNKSKQAKAKPPAGNSPVLTTP